MSLRRGLSVAALIVTFIVAVTLALIVANHRYKEITNGNVDYSYFLQFTVRAFDPSIVPIISINPPQPGRDLTFMEGADSGSGIWQWVHFEPIKIGSALLYTLTHSISASFGFYVVLFFLPLLYGAFLLLKRVAHDDILTVALIALATYPSSLLYATGNLRPFFVLPSLFVCFALSMAYRRPLAEKILFFSLFLLVREEALVLSAAILIWEFLRNRREGQSNKSTFILFCIWLGWLTVTVLYFFNTGYTMHPPLPFSVLIPAALACLGALIALLWWFWREGARAWPFVPEVFFGLITIIPVSIASGFSDTLQLSPLRIIYGRYGLTLFSILVVLFILYVCGRRQAFLVRKLGMLFFILCIGFGVASELVPHASSVLAYMARWDARAQDEAFVYRVAASIPKSTPVLLDTMTMVAFYDHDYTYAYDLLPYRLHDNIYGRDYPANLGELRTFIQSGNIPYAVLMNSDAGPLLELLQQSGRDVVLVEKNKTFSFYRIEPDSRPQTQKNEPM
ncbi:hypothetical protein KGM48_03445 [Patescibacteria group bacterium]|nr:hypothetical protein [Patescibacteria group bacterium]